MVKINTVEAPENDVDLEFYRAFYKDMNEKSDQEALAHWNKHGRPEGRFSSAEAALVKYQQHPGLPADFDAIQYLECNPDVAQNCKWNFQAIEHYLKSGMAENRFYNKDAAKEAEKAKTTPVGVVKTEVIPGENFDADFYRLMYQDVRTVSDEKCLEHFLKYGNKEGRFANFEGFFETHENRKNFPEDFSLAAYIWKNPDLAQKLSSDYAYLIHFLNSGQEEKRSSTPDTISAKFIKDYYGVDIDDLDLNPAFESHAVQTFMALQEALETNYKTVTFLCAEELCAYHGVFSADFLEIFDHEAYRYSNHALIEENVPNTHAHHLEHFLTTGTHHAAQISYDYYFDEKFYYHQYKNDFPRKINPTNMESDLFLSQEENIITLYTHWIYTGITHGMFPNLEIWAQNEYSFELPKSINNNIWIYKDLNDDLKKVTKPGDLLTHIIMHGISEYRNGLVHNDETAAFYSNVAQFLIEKGKRNEAVKVYNNILTSSPHFPKARHDLADDLLRHGFYKEAIRYYEMLFERNSASQWSYINCSSAYESLNDNLNAAKTLQKGSKAFPDDVNLKIRAKKSALHHFSIIHKDARKQALFRGIPYAQEMMHNALSLFESNQFAPLKDSPIKNIAIIGNHDLPQCRFYRIDQKVEQLKESGYHVTVYKHTENLDGYHARIDDFDAVIFYRIPAIPKLMEAITAANVRGIPTFYEIDDLLFDEALFPPPLETYAEQISAAQHAAIAADVPLIHHAMKMCRFGLASTKALASEMEPIVQSGKVFLHHNAFGSLHETMAALPLVKKPADAPITIFYGSGTKAHKDDFHDIIEPVFLDLFEKYGNRIKFIVVGYISMTQSLKKLGNSLELIEPIWDMEDYWTLMRTKADINLAMLSRSRVTDAKSEIKWMEAAMFSIPSVVSRTAAYEDVIEGGKSGFLCDTKEDFFKAIDVLVSDTEKRTAIGNAAREAVLKKYSIATQADNLDTIFSSFARPSHIKPKTKIAIVNVFYPPQAVGGATRVVYDNVSDIIAEFGDQFEISIFTSQNGEVPYELTRYTHDGVSVTAVTTENTEYLEQRITDPQMAIAFSRFLDQTQPDIVHFHCIQRLTTSIVSQTRQRKIPYIITAHDGWWISDTQFLVDQYDDIKLYQYDDKKIDAKNKPNNRQTALKKDLLGAHHLAAVSEPFANIYKSAGVPNVITVENGVSKLDPAPRYRSSSGRVRLAHIGGMARHKGFHLVRHALKASPEFSNLELLVVDHARPKGSVASEQWGGTPVTLIAKVDQKEIANLFADIDVLLAPSIWPESYGLVTREALMCGCHVIAGDRGGIGLCVDHGMNGLVIPVDNANGLKSALSEVNANPEFYRDSPESIPPLRMAVQQARDLVKLYRDILT